MKRGKLLFIINPKSGKAQIKPYLLEILNIFTRAGYEVTTHVTQAQGDAKQVAEVSGEFCDLLACSGGDGTLDEVVSGMMKGNYRKPICYIPAGSTNDFAGSLNIPKSMDKAAYLAVKGVPFACDLGKFNEDIFVYVAAFGAFTAVSYDTDQSLKNVLGHTAYVLKGLQSLSSLKSYHLKVTYDDGETGERHTLEGKFIYGMITNSISVGGFRNITGKDVELNDGQFEVTLIRLPDNMQELNNMITALTDRNLKALEDKKKESKVGSAKKPKDEFIYWFKSGHVEIQSKEDVAWTLDGEFGGIHKEVTIDNLKEAFTILTPDETKRRIRTNKEK